MRNKQRTSTQAAATAADNNTAPSPAAAPTPQASNFTDFAGLQRHLPAYGPRTLRDMVGTVIPVIRPPGARKLCFHLPSVDNSLLRFQRGGIE